MPNTLQSLKHLKRYQVEAFWSKAYAEQVAANAALIAAAPDMYEALKALRDEINEMKYGKPFAGRPHAKMDAADAALAKAEGRS